jgi:hypothetical protein
VAVSAKVSRTSRDGNWTAELRAFKINLFVYKAIGATLTVRHKQLRRSRWAPWSAPQPAWVAGVVPDISISNTYQGLLPSLSPAAARRSCSAVQASSCDCRLWSIGVSISMDASADTGLPNPGTTLPGAGPSLDVRSVDSNGSATLPNGEVLALGPVSAS